MAKIKYTKEQTMIYKTLQLNVNHFHKLYKVYPFEPKLNFLTSISSILLNKPPNDGSKCCVCSALKMRSVMCISYRLHD